MRLLHLFLAASVVSCAPPRGGVSGQSEVEVQADQSDEISQDAGVTPLTYRATAGPTVADGLEGVIEYDRGCVYVRSDGKRFLIFWPDDSVTTKGDLVVFGGRVLVHSATIRLTGTAAFARPPEAWPEDRRPDCDYTNTFAVAGGIRR